MPATLAKFPDEVLTELKKLDDDFEDGNLTKKGLFNKKWLLYKPLADQKSIRQYELLKERFDKKEIEESEYLESLNKILTKVSPNGAGVISSETDNDTVETTPTKKVTKSVFDSPVPGPSSGTPKFVKKNRQSNDAGRRSSRKSSGPSSDQNTITSMFASPKSKSIKDTNEDKNQNSKNGNSTSTEDEENHHKNGHDSKSKEKTATQDNPIEGSNSVDDGKMSIDSLYDVIGVEKKNSSVQLETITEESEELDSKKIKLEESEIKPTLVTKVKKESIKVALERCEICHQLECDVKIYGGHPNGAVEEFIALTDPKLSLFTGEEDVFNEDDAHPQNKITSFCVYDKNGHLCPFDSGLIERNVFLYFSGYLKPIYEEDGSPEGGIPAKDLGPINEWWISGFDGGEKALVGFSTAYGEYFLMEPSIDYAPMVESVKEKMYLGKLVIECLLDEEEPEFEDLLNKLQTTVPPFGVPKITEDSLLRHAQFICDQVHSFEDAIDDPEQKFLITSPCMRYLARMANVTYGKRQTMRKSEKKQFNVKKPVWSKATTTPLVNNVFETFFSEQMDKNENDTKGPRRQRCGVCEACQTADCGTCIHCRDLVKFGGSGKSKQACVKRRCPNMAVQEADDSEPEDDCSDEMPKTEVKTVKAARTTGGKKEVSWSGDMITDDGRRKFYKTAIVGDEMITIGDCVSVEPVDPATPLVIGRVHYMYENKFSQKFMHAHWFMRSSETVLGETGDPQEIYMVDECENSLLSGVYSKVQVVRKEAVDNWNWQGGKPLSELANPVDPENDKMFFYQKRYNEIHGRFEDIGEEPVCQNPNIIHRFCPSCEREYRQKKFNNPYVEGRIDTPEDSKEVRYSSVKWKGDEYTVGCCVYLDPSVFKLKTYGAIFKSHTRKANKEKEVDEDLYPEFYRKSSDHIKGSNVMTPQPFNIGLITDIVTTTKDRLVLPSDICIRVLRFYRPENTIGINNQISQIDINKLYGSDEETLVNFEDVTGKCAVVFRENLMDDVYCWAKEGPNRFYFDESYDAKSQKLVDPSSILKTLGYVGKGKSKGKSSNQKKKVEIETWPSVKKPLQCLDVFAGCGGLSEGLHQSGIAETKWAIEKEEPAANAFKLNNPNATVFTDDCNLILKMAMNGELKTHKGQKLPQKGEVEMLVGGPPCQGFSGMNRFNSRQYSLFKNSLIVSYLSYCDYYRPRFFILENVRNFVSFKRSMVLKLTLRCLITMGYQVAFGVLQAGNYGVPQTRRRAIIIAAAPGEILPNFPEPMHVFNPRATQLSIVVDDKKFISNCNWVDSAPFRTITVRDAMSDLPSIPNGFDQEEIQYNSDPMSHFQKLIRGDQYNAMLRDHICKDMAPIVEARISQIPIASGSDWRDLPNIVVKLKDDTFTKKLVYTHHDKKNKKSSTGALRGVCACAGGKPCDPMDRQFNTLIPWCLPHTGNRHNHWSGLYGRLEWDGFFSTTVTNPEPMGKQGRVLHPEQTRVVSVRECARSQGFPDVYKFYGTILDKHRQVGNAVPPPMAAAIGREIRKCVSTKEKQEKHVEPMETDD